jgi:2-dehydropantoate 2-reductase
MDLPGVSRRRRRLSPKIGVFGAGSIGCYLGGRLIHAGHDVTMVGRLGAEIADRGLTLTDYRGGRVSLAPDTVRYAADARALSDREVVLVTVKSLGTEGAGRALAEVLAADAVVVSFQNGVGNMDVLRRTLRAGARVVAGMVPFNVLREDGGRFHLGTSGPLALERAGGAEAPIARALEDAGLPVKLRDDLRGVQWSKLLFNLNNSINALAGLPLREQLSNPTYRRILARAIREGLRALDAARIRPANEIPMIPWLAPHVLSLPDALFFRVARTMIRIDPTARSSMWDDLERRRATEIEHLNGEIVRLGERYGVATPVNRRIRELVLEVEAKKSGSPRIGPEELLRRVTP